MKKTILLAITAIACIKASAQVKPLDTITCTQVANIQQRAIQLISGSNIPTKESDEIRQQLISVANYFNQQKQEIIAEEAKKKSGSAVATHKKP